MPFEVLLTHDAIADLEEIVSWIDEHDAPAKAGRVLERIEAVIATLGPGFPSAAHIRESFSRLAYATTAKVSSSPIASSTGLRAGESMST